MGWGIFTQSSLIISIIQFTHPKAVNTDGQPARLTRFRAQLEPMIDCVIVPLSKQRRPCLPSQLATQNLSPKPDQWGRRACSWANANWVLVSC